MIPLCRCGHAAADHPEQHAEMCLVTGCTCYRLWLAPNRRGASPASPALRDLIAAGKRSPRVRSQRLAARIEVSIDELIKALRVEREREAARQQQNRQGRSRSKVSAA